MNFLIILKVALRSLRRTLLRSILTMLGIIIGVGAVIALVGIGNGAKARIEALASGPDATVLTFQAFSPRGSARVQLAPGEGFRLDDYDAIRERMPDIVAATPQVQASGASSAAARGRTANIKLTGLDVEGFTVLNRTLVAGSPFGKADVEKAASVCLLSQSLVTEFFPSLDPIGQLVRVGGLPWMVIGVVADDNSLRNSIFNGNQRDFAVFVPYTSVFRRLTRNATISLALKTETPAELAGVQQAVSDLLEERRGERKAEFVTTDFAEMLRNYGESLDTMTLLLASIAGISLLVGGIGIMNIMLVSVTERTREIGIRLALGTRGRDVLRQFIIEAVILSILGGLIGIALGVGAAQLITQLNDWPTEITPGAVLGAFLTSAAIGVFFGWYPARKAAQMDPIEALRYE